MRGFGYISALIKVAFALQPMSPGAYQAHLGRRSREIGLLTCGPATRQIEPAKQWTVTSSLPSRLTKHISRQDHARESSEFELFLRIDEHLIVGV